MIFFHSLLIIFLFEMFTPSTPMVPIQLLTSIWSCSLHIPHSIIDNQQVTQAGGNAELASHFYIFCSTVYGIFLHKKVTSITTTLTSKVWCTTCCYYLHPTHVINISKYRGRGIASGMWDYAWFNLNLCFCNCSLIFFIGLFHPSMPIVALKLINITWSFHLCPPFANFPHKVFLHPLSD